MRQVGRWRRFDEKLEPALALIIALLVVFWSSGLPPVIGMQLYAEQVLTAVLSFAAAICFLGTNVRGKRRQIGTAPGPDRFLAYGAVTFGCFMAWRFPVLSEEIYYRPVEAMCVAAAGLIIVLEALRRVIGYSLLAVLALVCLYALVSDQFSGPLQSRAIPPERLLTFLVLDSAAMAGAALFIGVSIVLPFILLARLLLVTGGSAFFSDVSCGLMGR
ncbi:MAG: hypothetical protein HN478_11220, partial [Rhodospirillaceae bacterium]|nr:hypothetical protein [Rhodospirillaceae bacterium]